MTETSRTDALDALILEFVAAHDFVISSQVEMAGGEGEEGASRRCVARLLGEGLVKVAPRMAWQRGAYRVTRAGLDQLGSAMPEPVMDLRRYWEEVGLAWLWMYARHRDGFGKVDAVYSQRQMRASDLASGRSLDDERLSAALRAKLASAAFGLSTGNGVYYPGLVCVVAEGRVMIEVVLSAPSQRWIDQLLEGVVVTPQIAGAVVFGPSLEMLEGVQTAVEHRGLAHLVSVQRANMAYDAV